MLVRPLITNFKMTELTAVSANSPLLQPIKSLAHSLSVWGIGMWGVSLWTGIHLLPKLPASEIKQSFLSTDLASSLAFEQWAARPHFWLQFDWDFFSFSSDSLTSQELPQSQTRWENWSITHLNHKGREVPASCNIVPKISNWCAIQQLLVHSHGCAIITTNSRTIPSPQEEFISSQFQFSPPLSSCHPQIHFLSLWIC